MATAYMIISLAACIGFVSVMVLAAVVDLNTLRIPNSLIAVACVVWVAEHIVLLVLSGFPFSAWEILVSSFGFSSGGFFASLFQVFAGLLAFTSGLGSHAPTIGEAITGALALGGGSLVVSMAYEFVSGKPSMGGGDIKLLFVAGLYLGWWRGFFCVMIACIAFLVISAVLPRISWRPQAYVSEAGLSSNETSNETSDEKNRATNDETVTNAASNDGAEEEPWDDEVIVAVLDDDAANSASSNDDEGEEPFGFPFAPAIAVGALIALVLP